MKLFVAWNRALLAWIALETVVLNRIYSTAMHEGDLLCLKLVYIIHFAAKLSVSKRSVMDAAVVHAAFTYFL